jgi:hypothetical protein
LSCLLCSRLVSSLLLSFFLYISLVWTTNINLLLIFTLSSRRFLSFGSHISLWQTPFSIYLLLLLSAVLRIPLSSTFCTVSHLIFARLTHVFLADIQFYSAVVWCVNEKKNYFCTWSC